MHCDNSASEVFISRKLEPGILDHAFELFLSGKFANALDKVLVPVEEQRILVVDKMRDEFELNQEREKI